ncbi:hypothetical protein DY000_02047772 [Brassica cretica]|uniref:Uncharacterized protein n=1 Tax=Brassica cretica TaxID=69181 RepID=A0ABQ7ETE3_BRACR|nr:hypothetical protein DY000_02047772 [Brassica cretica]
MYMVWWFVMVSGCTKKDLVGGASIVMYAVCSHIKSEWKTHSHMWFSHQRSGVSFGIVRVWSRIRGARRAHSQSNSISSLDMERLYFDGYILQPCRPCKRYPFVGYRNAARIEEFLGLVASIDWELFNKTLQNSLVHWLIGKNENGRLIPWWSHFSWFLYLNGSRFIT